MLERRSALETALASGGRDGADGKRACRLGEIRGWWLVQAAGFAWTMTEVERALAPVLGGRLPARVGETALLDGRLVLRTGPEQVWVAGREGDAAAARLLDVVPEAAGAATPLSHSRSRILIAGEPARAVLAKGIPLDLHPDAFPVGQAALTGLHHTPVLLHRASEDRYELWAMRSFALACWEWLADAALEFGYDVATEQA
jgi:sarcosine oxidase subunit gamma